MTMAHRFLMQIDLPSKSPIDSAWNGGNFGVVMLLLVLLAGGLAAAYYFVKRFGMIRQSGSGHLEILETRALGGRQYILVGKYGRDTFLLGICPGRIDYLCRLEQDGGDAGFDKLLDGAAARESGNME